MTQLLVNALIAGSLLALVSSGLALVYGLLGVFNLALGQLVLLGGYLTWWFSVALGLPLLPSILLGFASGAIVTWLMFEVAVRPFYRRHRFLPLVTTMAVSQIFDGAILLFFGETPRVILAGEKHFFTIWNARMSVEQLVLVCVTLIILGTIGYVIQYTAIGRSIRASVQHPDAARSLGISSSFLHRMVFIVSGLLAAGGGMFIAIDQNLSPTLSFSLTVKAYAAVIAGGRDSIPGTVACAFFIALLEQLAVGVPWWNGMYISAGYQVVVALVFIIAALLVRPQGIFRLKSRTA